MTSIAIQPVSPLQKQQVISLLAASRLPVKDLSAELTNFLVASANDKVVGVVGLEIYAGSGLLRSLAVDQAYRNQQLGTLLVDGIEQQARQLGLAGMYLLTETAKDFFTARGYETINRQGAPAELQKSSEFSHTCPSTAVTMKKLL